MSFVSSTGKRRYPSREWSSSGFTVIWAFLRSVSLKLSVFTMRMPPRFRSIRFVLSAAGFITMRTSTASPGV